MNAEALKELLKPFGEVAVKRMFGGYGVYAEGLCFAIESDGEVFLKVDTESRASFSAAGSSPFIYVAKGKPMATSYWRLPANAHDEADELIRWAALGPGGGAARGRSQGETEGGGAKTGEGQGEGSLTRLGRPFSASARGKRARWRWPHAPAGRALGWRRAPCPRACLREATPASGRVIGHVRLPADGPLEPSQAQHFRKVWPG